MLVDVASINGMANPFSEADIADAMPNSGTSKLRKPIKSSKSSKPGKPNKLSEFNNLWEETNALFRPYTNPSPIFDASGTAADPVKKSHAAARVR
jgi:hypothetical protein